MKTESNGERKTWKETDPRTVRQKILAGARKWMGPWEGLVFMRLRRNLKYFIFCLTSPPDIHISSHLTTTTFWPFKSSLAMIDAKRPSMWCLASTSTTFAQTPDPDTIFAASSSLSKGVDFGGEGVYKWGWLGFLKLGLSSECQVSCVRWAVVSSKHGPEVGKHELV
jgi:hypothetical protein